MSLRDSLKGADVRAPALDGATTWINSEPLTTPTSRAMSLRTISGRTRA